MRSRFLTSLLVLLALPLGALFIGAPRTTAQKGTPTPAPPPPAPNLVAGASCTPLFVVDGNTVQCTVTVTNRADAPLPAIIPAGANLVRDVVSPSPLAAVAVTAAFGGVPGAYSCSWVGGVIDCAAQATDSIAPGTSRGFTVRFIVSTYDGNQTITNQATADPGAVVTEIREDDNVSGVVRVTVCPMGQPCQPPGK